MNIRLMVIAKLQQCLSMLAPGLPGLAGASLVIGKISAGLAPPLTACRARPLRIVRKVPARLLAAFFARFACALGIVGKIARTAALSAAGGLIPLICHGIASAC